MAQPNNASIKIFGSKDAPQREAIKKVISESIAKFNLTYHAEIEIMFVDKGKISALNNLHRGKNSPTDVLSFPQTQFGMKKSMLGSIVICREIVEEKGEQLDDVLKHGLLHLLGYDHETDEIEWEEAASKISCKL